MKSVYNFLKNKWSNWIPFGSYSTSLESLAVFRIIFSLYILLFILPRGLWVSELPNSFFFEPVIITSFFTQIPHYSFFYILNLLAIIAALFLLVGYKARLASFTLASVLLVLNSWMHSFGKINHGILIIVALLVLACSGWGYKYSISTEKNISKIKKAMKNNQFYLGVLAFLVSLAMFSAAVPKIASGWLSGDILATHTHFINRYFLLNTHNILQNFFIDFSPYFFWKTTDWLVVFFEAAFIVFCFKRNNFIKVLYVALWFHAMVYVLFKIFFASTLIVYAAFIDWKKILEKIEQLTSKFIIGTKYLCNRYIRKNITISFLSFFCVVIILSIIILEAHINNLIFPVRGLKGDLHIMLLQIIPLVVSTIYMINLTIVKRKRSIS